MVVKLTIALSVVLFLHTPSSVDGQCSGLTGTHTESASSSSVGDITSYNYPSYYSNYIDCTSTIENSGSGEILFYVEYEDIEDHYDFLKLYSGSVINSLLYHSDYNYLSVVGVTSPGDDLIATFTTDYSVTYGGYKVSFIEVDLQSQASCGSSLPAGAAAQQLCFVHTSSTVPCTWTISAEDTSKSVEIVILLVHGFVKISEGGQDTFFYNAGGRYVGQLGTDVQVIGQEDQDFVVQFSSSTESSIVEGAVTPATTSSSICSTSTRTSSYLQFLNSPSYPGPYPNYLYCSVVITAEDQTESVKVTLLDLAVDFYDSLSIIDGPDYSYNPFSPIGTGGIYTSSGSSVYLVFQTNDYGQYRGFNLSYQSVAREIPSCIQSYDTVENVTSGTTEHTMHSPNYPGFYDDLFDGYWLIVKPTETDNIVLDFRDFQVENANDCMYDYVDIYDGACTSDPLITRLCGYVPTTFEDSTGLYILIHFHTDVSVTKKGWSLTHYIGQYQDPDAAAATNDDGGSGVQDYIYPIIAIVVILIIAAVIFTVFYCKGRGRVGAGEAKPEMKRRTTHELMAELSNRLGPAQTEKQVKAKRKPIRYHPEPQPPGPNVNIIHRGQWPHPPPGLSDPAYPPDFMSVGSQMPPTNIAPVFAPGSNIPPSAPPSAPPLPGTSTPSMIPPPYSYFTPSEARAAGLHG